MNHNILIENFEKIYLSRCQDVKMSAPDTPGDDSVTGWPQRPRVSPWLRASLSLLPIFGLPSSLVTQLTEPAQPDGDSSSINLNHLSRWRLKSVRQFILPSPYYSFFPLNFWTKWIGIPIFLIYLHCTDKICLFRFPQCVNWWSHWLKKIFDFFMLRCSCELHSCSYRSQGYLIFLWTYWICVSRSPFK